MCDTPLRGTEELSVASSYYRAVNEMADMALLELAEMPPIYYQPYLISVKKKIVLISLLK